MPKHYFAGGRSGPTACLALCIFLLCACSPALDWREVRATDSPYTVLMPAKPSVQTRQVTLDGARLDMTMQGAEVSDVTFAIGSVTLPDHRQALAAAVALQAALVRNLGATIKQQKTVTVDGLPMQEISAQGKSPRGAALDLHARFAARGNRAYQALVVGPVGKVSAQASETFLESFHPASL
ncbi:MAG: hypothetical protein JWP36_1428 [Paucimonas sp.]|jgi:hypothetical protein|nr:hypothetical protein [Paucimonas sp.]